MKPNLSVIFPLSCVTHVLNPMKYLHYICRDITNNCMNVTICYPSFTNTKIYTYGFFLGSLELIPPEKICLIKRILLGSRSFYHYKKYALQRRGRHDATVKTTSQSKYSDVGSYHYAKFVF